MIFEKKVDSLLNNKAIGNSFVENAFKVTSETTSYEGAKKYSTTGNLFVDNFASISHFKEPRSYKEVSKDMCMLWSIHPQTCLKLAVYIRLISRKSVVLTEQKIVLDTQKGAGLKNEGIMRMLWIAINHPNTFKANIAYYIAAGCWSDIFKMMSLDLQYHGWSERKLDWHFLYTVISAGLLNEDSTHLVRKYLPTIRTNKNCTTLESQADTIIGRWLARKLYSEDLKETSYRKYRKLKSEGKAHDWQQKITFELYDKINFDTIAGRALSILVGSQFLQNHNLVDRYTEWIENKPIAKFTGYVFELFKPFGNSSGSLPVEKQIQITINKQFNKLVQDHKDGNNTNSGLLVVRDTSGSMTGTAVGCNMSSFAISKALALYFSEFLTGPFAGHFAEFSDECILHEWLGKTPCEKWINDDCSTFAGTNFQSVIDMLIEVKETGVRESEFPSGILCISDGEFAHPGGRNESPVSLTNFQLAKRRLRNAGFSDEFVDNFRIILWDIPNTFYHHDTKVKFEDFADAPGFIYMSGYDASIVTFLLEGKRTKSVPKTAAELFNVAMNQELLNSLKVMPDKKKVTNKRIKKHD